MLIRIRKVRTGNGRGARTLTVTEHLAVGKRVVGTQWGAGQLQSILYNSVPIHLEGTPFPVVAHLPGIWGGTLPLRPKPPRARVKPVGRGINTAPRAKRSLKLRTMKNPVTERNVPQHVRVDHTPVMRIGHIHPTQQLPLLVRPAVPDCIT